MDNLERVKRIRLKNDSDRTIRKIDAMISANPAVVTTYAGVDPATGLSQSVSADGSSSYNRQIFIKKLKVGDVVPVTLKGGTGSGFIDGLSQTKKVT